MATAGWPFRDPEELSRLRSDRGLLSSAIEELMRFDTSVPMLSAGFSKTSNSTACRFRAVQKSVCFSLPPTVTRMSSPILIDSTSAVEKTRTWHLAPEFISASVHRWLGRVGHLLCDIVGPSTKYDAHRRAPVEEEFHRAGARRIDGDRSLRSFITALSPTGDFPSRGAADSETWQQSTAQGSWCSGRRARRSRYSWGTWGARFGRKG